MGTDGWRGRRKWAGSEWPPFPWRLPPPLSGGHPPTPGPSTVRPAATRAWPATWPPNTRGRSSFQLTPRKRLTSRGSRSSRATSSSRTFIAVMLVRGFRSAEEDAGGVVDPAVDGLELPDGVGQGDPDDVGPPQGD